MIQPTPQYKIGEIVRYSVEENLKITGQKRYGQIEQITITSDHVWYLLSDGAGRILEHRIDMRYIEMPF
jgi:hypothetical protein